MSLEESASFWVHRRGDACYCLQRQGRPATPRRPKARACSTGWLAANYEGCSLHLSRVNNIELKKNKQWQCQILFWLIVWLFCPSANGNNRKRNEGDDNCIKKNLTSKTNTKQSQRKCRRGSRCPALRALPSTTSPAWWQPWLTRSINRKTILCCIL